MFKHIIARFQDGCRGFFNVLQFTFVVLRIEVPIEIISGFLARKNRFQEMADLVDPHVQTLTRHNGVAELRIKGLDRKGDPISWEQVPGIFRWVSIPSIWGDDNFPRGLAEPGAPPTKRAVSNDVVTTRAHQDQVFIVG